ncbi:glycosyltransferase family 39 protein [Patescibacteria group bacterium]|nr:glycosyltransferase family 39 protein [Patescibacteria group bacterium]
MSLLRSTICKKISPTCWIFFLFLVLHVFLFNINTAEWGDSYRILRAGEELRRGVYPEDEKRPPLMSYFLSLRPSLADPVYFGRALLLVFSVMSFAIFSGLAEIYIKSDRYKNLALLLFSLNPVYLYWSIRIMADVPFAVFVLLAFYLFSKWRGSMNGFKCVLLGLLAGLSVLMRFEGYLLLGSLAAGLMFHSISDLVGRFTASIRKRWVNVVAYISASLFVLVPYIVYRNPFSSSYLGEPSGREYDAHMGLVYLFSFIFLFGFVHAAVFLVRGRKLSYEFLSKHFGLFVFVVLEMLLILAWPAAIPRLFVCVIPFFIIMISLSVKEFFEEPLVKRNVLDLAVLLMPFVYVLAQYLLGLQFLVMTRKLIFLVFILQLPIVLAVIARKYAWFVYSVSLSTLVWSFLVIIMHKDIFVSVKSAADYSVNNLQGKIGHNDLSSVSNWYLNYVGDKTVGKYYDIDSGGKLTSDFVYENNLDYLIITNEHNLNLEIDFDKRPYLKVLKEFRYNVNGSEFVTYVAKVEKEELCNCR